MVTVIRENKSKSIGIEGVLPTDLVEISDDITIAPFDMVLLEGELYIQGKGGEVKHIKALDSND